MLREANTVGSKASDALIQEDVIATKEELERIRRTSGEPRVKPFPIICLRLRKRKDDHCAYAPRDEPTWVLGVVHDQASEDGESDGRDYIFFPRNIQARAESRNSRIGRVTSFVRYVARRSRARAVSGKHVITGHRRSGTKQSRGRSRTRSSSSYSRHRPKSWWIGSKPVAPRIPNRSFVDSRVQSRAEAIDCTST